MLKCDDACIMVTCRVKRTKWAMNYSQLAPKFKMNIRPVHSALYKKLLCNLPTPQPFFYHCNTPDLARIYTRSNVIL